MGLAEAVLATRTQPVTEQRALQVTPWGDWGGSHASAAGMNVSPDSSLQLLTVYGCVTLISDMIATLPRDIFRRQADGIRLEVTQKPRWFEQPNSTFDIIDFLTQTLTSLLLDGNAYWAYSVDLNFLPAQITVLNPTVVQIRDDGNGPVYYVNGQQFIGRLLHIRSTTRAGSLKGMSPIEAARQSVGLGLASQEFAGSFYSNGTTMSGVIQTPGELNSEQARTLRDNWGRDHHGASKAHLPGVLTNGATWKQIQVTPEQAQFLQSREYQSAEICSQLFLLDPTMLGIARSGQTITYQNIEQRGTHLVQVTFLRWIIRLERAFTFLLPKPQFMKFNVDGLQRADFKTRYEAARIALGPTQPFETVDEVRGFEDLPPLGGPHGKIIEPAPPAPPAPPPAPPVPPQQNTHHIVVEAANIHIPEQPTPIVNVAAPNPTPVLVEYHADHQFDVNPTPVNVEPAVVNIAAAEAPVVNVDVQPTPFEVNVAPAEVNIDVNPTPITIEPAEVNVNIAPAENRIDVHPTPLEVNVAPAEVNVLPAAVTVDSPVVNVHPQDVRVDAPIVNVPPSNIRIDAPQIHMPKVGKIRRTFERDEHGVTIAVIEEPIEDEPEGSTDEGTES